MDNSLTHLPRLKTGVALYLQPQRSDTSLRIGTARSNFSLDGLGDISALKAALALFGTEGTIADACHLSGLSEKDILALIQNLGEGNLIQSQSGAIHLSGRYLERITTKDAAYLEIRQRIAPELVQTRWRDGVHDSGVAMMNSRQGVRVEISGGGRAATLLYGILLASGVTFTTFTPSSRSTSPLIENIDICAGFLRRTDIGATFRGRTDEIGRELSLFPVEAAESAQEVDEGFHEELFKIHFGAVDEATRALWMSTGQIHLIVGAADGGLLPIGPLIKPGKTPCSRCATLTMYEARGFTEALAITGEGSKTEELPVAAAHYVASLIASALLQEIDTGFNDLLGATYTVDLVTLSQSARTTLPRHPLCGCAFQ